MTDAADDSDAFIAASLERAMRAYRKPVSSTCEECGEAATVLPNGVRARFCDGCLADYQASR